ncbi:ubiquitin conjugating enzyme [Paecilomyces variotii No. 5]|uniref:Ubiquitin conjugating enzyme n=1 Tax=Byssochlamys spectabilis (strain No. 5 / NBRC 109023) TaxID=1356009 RepID=V5FXD0_BYSSN|nr:ubiquitin conjugating enzyme [Paecilomyces variotii No. 5]
MESPDAASARATQADRKFHPDDICFLKSDPSLIGMVDRTYYDVETHEPLGEDLIVSHVPVPENQLLEFLSSGIPPKGYVYVAFSEPTQGSSLVHENDLELVDRSLEIGHVVKRHPRDTVSGTVISASTKCILQPIAFRPIDPGTGERGAVHFTEKAIDNLDEPSDPQSQDTPPLLFDIPSEELRDYDEFHEGDYIIYKQKFGVVQQVDRDTVFMLPNRTLVSPLNPVLELPISLGTKSIVSMPSNADGVNHFPLGEGRWCTSMPSETLYPGQFALTSASNLRRGHWISGGYESENPLPGGHIVATPPMDIHVDWLCSNIFAAGRLPFGPSSEVIRASTIQGQAVIYDEGKLPRNSSHGTARSDSYLSVGDRVRFRDPAGAAVKYSQFDRIPKDQSFGYDLNIFKIVSCKTEITVQWQDLSVTTEPSTSLYKFPVPEAEVWPGETVSLKDAIETHSTNDRGTPGPLHYHTSESNSTVLRPKKIGIVQTVNSKERIASVRWYRDPKVDLLHQGNVLRPTSVLGEISNEITDVSMYELVTHPVLVKSRGDIVLMPPQRIHETIIPQTPSHPSSAGAGPCLFSYLFPANFSQANMYLDHLKDVLLTQEWFKDSTEIDTTPLPARHSVRRDDFPLKTPNDWIGHIISIGLDGTITVRLGALQDCRDVCVPLEKILFVLDGDAESGNGPSVEGLDELFDAPLDLYGLDSRAIFQMIVYEGGQRLDGDSDDGLWETEDEDDENEDSASDEDTSDDSFPVPEVAEITVAEQPDNEESGDVRAPAAEERTSDNNQSAIVGSAQPISCPPNFAVLETSPPPDHHFVGRPVPDAGAQRLRRVRREYEILVTSLPEGIFVRTWESRTDLLRVLIIGPQGTPYEHAPFVIDFYFDEQFPVSPPATFFHSWTNGMGQINPNLYEDGKICLSILGTWPTKNPDENWSSTKSTVLQILVSIMGLVLVKDPFYSTYETGAALGTMLTVILDEAGFEAFASEGDSRVEASQYTERAFVMTRSFIKYALDNSIADLEDVLVWHYLPGSGGTDGSQRPQLLKQVISEGNSMIDHYNSTPNKAVTRENAASPFISRLSLGAVVMLRKHITALQKILAVATEISDTA